MRYNEAMNGPDCKLWKQSVEEEHEQMVHHKVWIPELKDKILKGVKVVSSMWACKEKSNSTFRARLNAHGLNRKMEYIMTVHPSLPL